jgi:hypothetical protein
VGSPEKCPTCGSDKRHVFIGPMCILSPDLTYHSWRDSEPDEDEYVHDGTCCTNAAGMPNCFDPATTPSAPAEGRRCPSCKGTAEDGRRLPSDGEGMSSYCEDPRHPAPDDASAGRPTQAEIDAALAGVVKRGGKGES